MIKLYSFGSAFGLPDPSPFVTKVDLYLKLCGIEYESVAGTNNLSNAPKNKLPFIDDNGQIIADSTFIIDHLIANHGANLDSWLNDEQRAIAQLVGKSLDENLYWTIVHARWINDDSWPIVRERFFSDLPFPLSKIVPAVARKATRRQITGHGMGKHTDAEIHEIAKRSLDSLSVMLGDKTYFFGTQVSSIDVTAFAMIGSLTLSTIDNKMSRLAKSYENLNSFTQRILEEHYPELTS